MKDYLADFPTEYRCVTGRHTWGTPEEAAKCCNGYVRALETVVDKRDIGGPLIERYVLVATDDLSALEEGSSTGTLNPWLEHIM